MNININAYIYNANCKLIVLGYRNDSGVENVIVPDV